jgi:structural maintenance of chromosome 4
MGDENRDPNILGDTENHSPEPRLTIKSLVLENFKSYAGVQEIGPFHRSFSAIVGPNGSGKSNVIDAILFVFGKQAKTLRLNKVSDLIHNSEQFPNLSSARVTVNFYDTVLKVTQRVASLPR